MKPEARQIPRLNDFPLQAYDKLRYADTDKQGHVNNAHFSTFLETGRVSFMLSEEFPMDTEKQSFVVANINLQLISEIHWPGSVEIGTWVDKIGNTSITFFQGIFQKQRCCATAFTVVVQLDNGSQKPYPLSEPTKMLLAKYVKPTK